jgi:hypothetical protein
MSRQLNALKHGLYTKNPLLPFENKRQFHRHVRCIKQDLQPENGLQEQAVQEIAEFLWRMKRHQELIITLEKQIMAQYTPRMMAEVSGVPSDLHFAAPDWLLDLPYPADREYRQYAKKVCHQYEEARANFATIPNLVKIIDKYPELFMEADHYLRDTEGRTVIQVVSRSLEPIWQHDPKGLWQIFFQTYAHLYYRAHAKDLEKIIRHEIEIWFYMKASEDRRLQREKDTSLRMSVELRKKIQHYAQLKKNHWIFSKELQALSGLSNLEFVQECRDCSLMVSGVHAQGGVGLLNLQVH